MLNRIILQGRLVADPELRHTPNGIPVATFRLAVDRDLKDRETGEKKADFINIVAWRHTAEFVSRFFTKGRMALVDGRLQNREYNDKDGNRRTFTEVVADNVHFGDSRRDYEGGGNGYAPAPQPSRGGYNNAPAGGSYQNAPAPNGGGYPASGGGYPAAPTVDQFADLTDDDGELPF